MSYGKVLCIIQARMGSERLPGKVMKKLGSKPIIEHVLSRVSRSNTVDHVVLATSDKLSEKIMVDYLTEADWSVFCGDENNVLKRYVDCEAEYKGDIIIRVTGDCPFIDADIIDHVVTYFQINDFDYVRLDVPDTFIRGFDVEVFTREAMHRVYDITKSINGESPYKEHVTLYMYRHPEKFRIGYVKGSDLYCKDYRLCVDTKEDYELVKNIYEHFCDEWVSAKDIVEYLDANPNIASINRDIEQKQS
ncbi:MAG: glycosyltransferase family protein [Lachnospiraceae bacterium]|nr:glycosyltransferase family protein [Lachnospiraceae bacterium]MDE6252002.1 glycosyltransferase family protein [Lachnospiraceae bacterium]